MSRTRAGSGASLCFAIIICVYCEHALGAQTLHVQAGAGVAASTSTLSASSSPPSQPLIAVTTRITDRSTDGESPNPKSGKYDEAHVTDIDWYQKKARVGGIPAWMWVAMVTCVISAAFAGIWLWRRHARRVARKAGNAAKEAEESRDQEAEKAAGVTLDGNHANIHAEDLSDEMTQETPSIPRQGQFVGVPDVPYRS